MPSLGYGVSGSAPYSRARLVSFSQNSSCGSVAVGAGRPDQLQGAQERMVDGHRPVTRSPQGRPGLISVTPGPGVAEPGSGQHMDGFGLRPGVGDLDRHQQVIRAGLGVVHLGDPVPVAVERAGIQQLILRLVAAPPGVGVDQVLIRERALRVVVAPPVPRMAGHRVQVPPVLLDILAVIALRAGQPERPLLQDRVPPVPQRQRKAQPLLDIAEPGQAVLTPPVRPGPRLVVRQVIPRVAVGTVILPHRAPLPLADIRPPPVPLRARLPQPVLQPPEPSHPIPFSTHCQPPSLDRAALLGGSPKPDDFAAVSDLSSPVGRFHLGENDGTPG